MKLHTRAREIRHRATQARLPTTWGEFTAHVYDDAESGVHHVALAMGPIDDGLPVLIRLHSECLTGDVLGSLRCDCGPQLQRALARIAAERRGLILYLRQEGRGIGLFNKVSAYALQDQGLDTVEANEHLGFPADARDYRIAAHILEDLGVQQVRLLTNNPRKIDELRRCGIQVVERVPLVVAPTADNAGYLKTKQLKMGHLFDEEPVTP
ncbi:MAG: ribA [Acidobacteria bacterium]|nr:ribA [Acidobacteriota bacterium]